MARLATHLEPRTADRRRTVTKIVDTTMPSRHAFKTLLGILAVSLFFTSPLRYTILISAAVLLLYMVIYHPRVLMYFIVTVSVAVIALHFLGEDYRHLPAP
jgi:hypothetical protein